jgi:hypothetical protein
MFDIDIFQGEDGEPGVMAKPGKLGIKVLNYIALNVCNMSNFPCVAGI